jgi:hypothetical protein
VLQCAYRRQSYGATDVSRTIVGGPLSIRSSKASARAQMVSTIRAIVRPGVVAFAAAWAAGRALSLDEAIATALNADGAV